MAIFGGRHSNSSRRARKEPEWEDDLDYEEEYEQDEYGDTPEDPEAYYQEETGEQYAENANSAEDQYAEDAGYDEEYADEDDLEWETGWEPESERRRKRTPGWVKALRAVVILLVIIAAAMIALDIVQRDRFAGASDINGVNVSRMTAEEAGAAVSNALELDKPVYLQDSQGGTVAQLRLGDLLRGADLYSEMDKIINTQHEKFAPFAFLGMGGGSYSLGWLDESSIESLIAGAAGDYGKSDPQPASLVKGDNGWELVPSKAGSRPDFAAAAASLKQLLSGDSLSNGSSMSVTIPTQSVTGDFSAEEAKLQAQMDAIDSVLNQTVSIDFGADTVITLGRAELSKVYDVSLTDTGADVSLNSEQLQAVLEELVSSNKLDGIDRKYATIGRDDLHYNDWDTGWVLKSQTLLKDVTKALKNGGGEVKAGYNYVGSVKAHFKSGNNSFIEINLDNQFLWFYRKGELVLCTPIVSGDVQTGTETPKGAFSVSYKQKNTKIAGKGYSYNVKYWIPFYGNIGIHDAEWRETGFGGDVYLTQGSHGCIEVPDDIIQAIYDNASTYIPVFVY